MIRTPDRWPRLTAGVLALCCAWHVVLVPAADAPAATQSAPQARFAIQEFRVLGNHVLDARSIERAVYPFLGEGRDIDTVKQAADALEKTYKDAGYGTVFVDIPEQTVDDGIVRLKVTEGHIESVHIRGARYFSEGQILAALPVLQPGNTPHLPTVQQELSAVNSRSADRAVTPVLKAGGDPGTVDVDLAVTDHLPLHGSLSYDDRHTADTTPNRATAVLSYDNLWQRQDSVSVQYQTAPAHPSEAEVLSANYLGHVADGLAAISYIRTSSNVLALGTLGVLGKGSIYGLHWVEPLAGDATGSKSVNFGVDYKDVLTQVLPDASGSSTPAGAITAPVHYLNWSIVYSQDWRAPASTVSAYGGANFGVRSLVNSPDQFENARYNANSGYFYLRGSITLTQNLPWRLSLLERLSGQWAANPLVNNEQYAIGGADTVRGYLEAESLGDSGAAGTIELHSPALGARVGPILSPLYAFAFVDAATASLVDPLPAQVSSTTVWSNGFGLRIDNPTGLSGAIDYATARRQGTRTTKDSGRLDFSFRIGF
jgi:hemolysin activation/secretion protein